MCFTLLCMCMCSTFTSFTTILFCSVHLKWLLNTWDMSSCVLHFALKWKAWISHYLITYAVSEGLNSDHLETLWLILHLFLSVLIKMLKKNNVRLVRVRVSGNRCRLQPSVTAAVANFNRAAVINTTTWIHSLTLILEEDNKISDRTIHNTCKTDIVD